MLDDAPETIPCAVCDKPAHERVHRGCRERMAANLRELPGLYRQLQGALVPGRRGGDGRTGTKTAPLPCSLEALDLRGRGGIEGVVGSWARDLCEREEWDIPDYRSVAAIVDWSCGILALNLAMICDEHPAVAEMARELNQIAGQARRIITGEKPPIKIPVGCEGCGFILRVSLDMDGIRCPRCQAQYDHRAMLNLTPTRNAAA
jgi:predicted Zn-ribbon and HTH transcriptional regulator